MKVTRISLTAWSVPSQEGKESFPGRAIPSKFGKEAVPGFFVAFNALGKAAFRISQATNPGSEAFPAFRVTLAAVGKALTRDYGVKTTFVQPAAARSKRS